MLVSPTNNVTGPLLPGKYYHIFNRANGFGRLFYTMENFAFFLRRYREYGNGIWQTYAYCLLINHFHFLIKPAEQEQIITEANRRNIWPTRTFFVHQCKHLIESPEWIMGTTPKALRELIDNNDDLRPLYASWIVAQQLRYLMLGFAKAVNKQQKRHGSLFQKPFRRKHVPEEDVRNLVVYIHRNPLHHGYTMSMDDYKWSSYHSLVTHQTDQLVSEETMQHFEGKEEFLKIHKIQQYEWKRHDVSSYQDPA